MSNVRSLGKEIMKSFTEIESWKKARELVKSVYGITAKEGLSRDYGLKDQIQRSAVSIMSNIAEGFDSGSDKSFINFLNYSYRSTSELESLFFIIFDLNYIEEQEFNSLLERTTEIKNLIRGFIKYLKS